MCPASRVTLFELTQPDKVEELNLDQQAALCLKSDALESVKLTNGVWQAFWHSAPSATMPFTPSANQSESVTLLVWLVPISNP